jgi:hypothetical protein
MSAQLRLVEVRKNGLKQNNVTARALRERFREAGVLAVSLVSSPGSGKTAFLEKTLSSYSPATASPRWWAISPPKMTPHVLPAARRR